MNAGPPPVLSRLRGRLWRLTVAALWVAVFMVNLAAALDQPAAAGTLADDLQASLCHSGEDAPPPAGGDASQTGDSHCALCHIFAAGVLATPGNGAVTVLSPAGQSAGPVPPQAAPPGATAPPSPAQPRAPPAVSV